MKHFILKYIAYATVIISTFGVCAGAFADDEDDDIDMVKLRHDAEAGDPASESLLATAYHEGAGGLKVDDAKAAKWYKKAAEQGDLEGEYNTGIAYYHGFGFKKDLTEAIGWFKKAAEQGYPEAEYILACGYQNGVGDLKVDLVQADLWLLRAEAQGNKEAASERITMESAMKDEDIAQAMILAKEPLPTQSLMPEKK